MTSGDDTLAGWLDALADRSPAPSGGAASAVTLAAAGSLAAMVARFSSSQLAGADQLVATADSLRRRAFELAAADEEAWAGVLGSWRAGTAAPDEGSELVAATEVPLRMVQLASEIAPVLRTLVEHGNPRLTGDALAGARLLMGAAASAATLVRLNLEDLPPPHRDRLLQGLEAAESAIDSVAGGGWLAPPELAPRDPAG